MGDPKGFLKVARRPARYRPVCERVRDFRDVALMRTPDESRFQASRCMDCGTPFCHWGCPLGNYIPEWNDAVHGRRWERAARLLAASNNFPELTGRVCPAPCEYACVVGIHDDPVTIRENELAIVEYAFEHGWIVPTPPPGRSGRRVAVVGSGPAGLACADLLNRAGHETVVYERDEECGGILRFGIPDFKLEKWVLDRRLDILAREGVRFETRVAVGADLPAARLLADFDAVCVAAGSRVPRDLPVDGRSLGGIVFAMEYLCAANRAANSRGEVPARLSAKDRTVVVIGGGDTGSDCVGTAHRQGARCVTQIELLPRPPECRDSAQPWPRYPMLLKTTSSHAEGGVREWSVLTRRFEGSAGRVERLSCARVEFEPAGPGTCPVMREVAGSEFAIEADLVVLALGFLRPEPGGLIGELGVALDGRGALATADGGHATSVPRLFAAGDARTGQSLVVKAIADGRNAARAIDRFLAGSSAP